MTNIEVMRSAVRDLYDGERWARRVKQMPDHQVMAIYMKRIVAQEAPQPEKKAEPPQQDDIPF